MLTFACGPTNSMRGAAFLSGIKNGLVADVGGTTMDVGEVQNGFPRPAGTAVSVADVQTNFSMPDVISIGLGGGSIIDREAVTVGPDSVGHRLLEEGVVFGGAVLTASDIAVAAGRTEMGDHPPGDLPDLAGLIGALDQKAGDAIARSRTSGEAMTVIAVGGGAVLLPDKLDGLEVVRPPHYDLANAIGAAIAQVSGEDPRVIALAEGMTREEAIQSVVGPPSRCRQQRSRPGHAATAQPERRAAGLSARQQPGDQRHGCRRTEDERGVTMANRIKKVDREALALIAKGSTVLAGGG